MHVTAKLPFYKILFEKKWVLETSAFQKNKVRDTNHTKKVLMIIPYVGQSCFFRIN